MFCSWGKCLIFWFMLLNAALLIANTLIAEKSKVFSVMAYNVKHVLLVAALFVKRCGISFSSMPGHVKCLNAMCRAASVYTIPFSVNSFINSCISLFNLFLIQYLCISQGFEGAFEEVAAAIWFSSQGCSDGDDEAAGCWSCREHWLTSCCTAGDTLFLLTCWMEGGNYMNQITQWN